MAKSYQVLDIVMDEEFNAMQAVLAEVRPSWKWDEVCKREFTAGITNKICGFYHNSDSKWSDMILIRLYGQNTDLIIDRAMEKKTMQILHAIGSGPALYAEVRNGLIYGFIPGKTTDEQSVRNPVISKLIAREMAKLHSIDLSAHPEIESSHPFLFEKVNQFFQCLPPRLSDDAKQKDWELFGKSLGELRLEFEYLMAVTTKHSKSPCGFTHNDLLLENVIYNSELDKVSFIDYEYSGCNYLFFDIANHFAEYAGVENPDHSLYPDKAYQKEWLKMYMDEYRRLNNTDFQLVGGIADELLNDACHQVQLFTLWSHMLWGIWSLVQAENSTIDFDYIAFAKSRLGFYFDKKVEFLAFTANDQQ